MTHVQCPNLEDRSMYHPLSLARTTFCLLRRSRSRFVPIDPSKSYHSHLWLDFEEHDRCRNVGKSIALVIMALVLRSCQEPRARNYCL